MVQATKRADAVAIEVSGLNKRFGAIQAVADLDFTVSPGRITGFLGPNGAGKTTTLRILLGLVHATSGTATIGGQRYQDIVDPIRRVGALLEATSFHPARRARDHLRMCALGAHVETARVDEVLELVGLRDAARRRVGGFSMGMRQRLGLAAALLGDPPVLVLDEPANGLDPQGIAWLREFLRYLADQGHTVLVSSHLLAEMSQTVDDVVIIAGGRVRASGPLSELTGRVHSAMRVRTPEAERLQGVLAAAHWPSRRLSQDLVLVEGLTAELLGPLLARSQIVIYELINQSTDLEAAFLSLTGPDIEPAPGEAPG
ncbi:MAG TPA: ABC transporter ATP-binding protein [Acidimicrobiales bacterium]|nr:ABC transporter ATP-binding protein [Acidimicrobiales bacterium]